MSCQSLRKMQCILHKMIQIHSIVVKNCLFGDQAVLTTYPQ